jgi:PEGA domain-containing protein
MIRSIVLSAALLTGCACAQTAVLLEGQPAVRCESGRGSFITIRREMKEGQVQFRANTLQGGWNLRKGVLTVTEAGITFTADSGETFRVDRQRSTLQKNGRGLWITWSNGERHYYFFASDNWGKSLGIGAPCMSLGQELGIDFAAGVAEFDRITASLKPAPPPEPAKPTTATLKLTSDPGGAQVYVDGVFKGQTDDSGQLVIESTPGDHNLRLDHADYKEWKGNVTFTGEHTEEKIAMVKRGPDPLSLDEIDQALSQGMTAARCAELVKQYGVNFALTPDVDKRLRNEGADDALLLTIAENKR